MPKVDVQAPKSSIKGARPSGTQVTAVLEILLRRRVNSCDRHIEVARHLCGSCNVTSVSQTLGSETLQKPMDERVRVILTPLRETPTLNVSKSMCMSVVT